MKRILRYLRARRFERDLQEELQAHLAEKADDLAEQGTPAAEARAAAHRQFGNPTLLAEQCRDRWVFRWLDALGQDLRYALRILRKSPGFTVVAILSLAFGIGVNTVIFSAVDRVLLRPLPFPESERLFAVWSRSPFRGAEHMQASAADFYDWQAGAHAFQSIACYTSWPMNLTNLEEPRRLEAQLVSAGFFDTLAAQPAIGRTFAADEDREGSPSVVVISDRFWKWLGQSPSILGRQITLNGSPATVIGVMPAGFAFPSRETDLWTPLAMNARNRANREGRWLRVIGRLRPGTSVREATAEMDVVANRLAAAWPATDAGWGISLVPLSQEVAGNAAPILTTLQAGGLLLLLITCANLANLLLARGAARSREIALRTALGAARTRILRQLIVESTVLAALGGTAGLALAAEGIALLRTFGDTIMPRAGTVSMSGTVALFALAATAFTALIFGIAPAFATSRVDLRSRVNRPGRSRSLLVAAEVALAAVLLVGAGLLSASLFRLVSTAPGFRTDHLLTMRLTLPRSKYAANPSQIAFFEQLLERVRSVPGVTDAGEVSDAPLSRNNPTLEFVVEGLARGPADPPVQAALRAISPGYLRTVGIALVAGRDFTLNDRAGSMPAALVNQTMARRYWPGASPIGRTVRLKEESRWLTVIGVVADIKHMGLDADEGPLAYVPYSQKTQDWLAWTTLVVRTGGDPLGFVAPVRQAIRGIDRDQPAAEIATLEDILSRSTAVPRFTTLTIATVSVFALLIALVGIYGLMAYTVARRMPELGIRLTLGASPRQIVGLLLRQAMLRVAVGIPVGLTAAWWLAQLLQGMLFEVRPHDVGTFAAVAGLLLATSLAAVAVPAARVLRIDPALSLRSE